MRTEMSTTEKIESDIEVINQNGLTSSEQEEFDETQSMVVQNLSNNLRAENSSSISLLTESATSLNTTASKFLNSYKGDFGDDEIRRPTINEAEIALKLALGANELMKTKLCYIRTGKDLLNNLHDVLE